MSDRSPDFEDLLAGLAQAAGTRSPLPDPAAVRRLGARRTARRRAVASVVALALIGGVAIAAAGLGPAGSSTPSGKATATPTAPSSTPTHSHPASPSTSPSSAPPSNSAAAPGGPESSAAAGAPPLSELVGIWQPTTGGIRSLAVDSDGVIGIGPAGGGEYPMCAGNLEAPVGVSYPITVACSDWGTQGLSIGLNGNGDLTLDVAASSSTSAYTITWVRTPLEGLVPNPVGSPVPTFLIGTWATQSCIDSFTIDAAGAVTWSATIQNGSRATATGNVVQLSDGTIRITTNIGGPGFWQVGLYGDGSLMVDGRYGPVVFNLTNGAQCASAGPDST